MNSEQSTDKPYINESAPGVSRGFSPILVEKITPRHSENGYNTVGNHDLPEIGVTDTTCSGLMFQEQDDVPVFVVKHGPGIVVYNIRGIEEYGFEAYANSDMSGTHKLRISETAEITRFFFKRGATDLASATNGEYFTALDRCGFYELQPPKLKPGWFKRTFHA